jgi:hypothetical protein
MSRRPALALATGLLAAACLTSCVQMPTTGPVTAVQNDQGQADPIQGPYSNPRPPQPNANPAQIVQGFLDAMTATPIQASAARQFLTKEEKPSWSPTRGVVVYDSKTPLHGTSEVSVHLHGAHAIGPHGNWEGRLPASQEKLVFPMQVEDKQWRIAHAPDALVVPQTWFQQQFQSSIIYFFDPSGRILVPEPVYLPTGDQQVTSLVRALLLGPRPGLAGVARTFIPPGLSSGLSVLVSPQGVAEVTLRGPGSVQLDPKTTQLMLAQLSWTLRQEPGIRFFKVTIGNHALTDSTGNSTFRVDGASGVDPAVSLGSGLIYGLHDGRIVSGQANRPSRVDGQFGDEATGIGAFAVSLDGSHAAGITGSSLLVGRIQGSPGPVRPVISGATGLLRPSWDFADRLWEISSGPHGGAIVQYYQGGRLHPVRVPGVTGRAVKLFLVSRAASRLVAVIRGGSADRIVVSRLRYDAAGAVTGASKASPVPWQSGGSPRVRDIGWVSPTGIAVLHLLTQGLSEVRTVSVDGSTPIDETVPTTIPGSVHQLAATQVIGLTSVAVLPGKLYDIAQPSPAVPYSGLHHITYAG